MRLRGVIGLLRTPLWRGIGAGHISLRFDVPGYGLISVLRTRCGASVGWATSVSCGRGAESQSGGQHQRPADAVRSLSRPMR